MEFGNVTIERKIPCVLRDGVTLFADIYRPAGQGEYPVLLMRQPYGRKIASTVSHAHPVWYASQGYMVVIQDVRGRGDSEGEFIPFLYEAEDGYDTVEWAAALPGSNGQVGMYGFSYQGVTQWAAASLAPPHLTAIAPSMTAADLYHGWMYPYGSFDVQSCLPWAYQLARDSARRAGDVKSEALCSQVMLDPGSVLRQLPLSEAHPILEKYMPAYFDWLNHPEYDEYWAQFNWLEAFRKQPVPALHIGGWYDFLLNGTWQSYTALQDGGRSPELFHRLEIGPWTHIPWGRYAGGADHGPEADGGMHLLHVQWFDYWLKGERENGMFEKAPVRYFEAGSSRWKEIDAFPAGGRLGESLRWYVTGSALPANGSLGGGRLTSHKESVDSSAAPDVFVYDARLPMPLSNALPADRRLQQDRYEILVYTGETLTEKMNLFGTPKLSVTCQVMDGPTDLAAVLTLLQPDGQAIFLSVGRAEIGLEISGEAGRKSGVNGVGPWQTIEISMRPVAVEIPEGSTLRLELTGSAYPMLLRHPNGVAIREVGHVGAELLGIAVVAVKSGIDAFSWLELPVVD